MAAFSSYNERDRRRQAFQLGIGATAAGMLAVPGFRRPAVRSLASVLASAGNVLGRATPPPGIASTAAELEGMLARNGAPEVAAMARQELFRRLEAPNAFSDPVGRAGRHLGRFFGVRATTLGEAVGGNAAAPWAAGAHAYLGGLIGAKAAEGLPVGGLATVQGQVFDFRGLQDAGQRVGRFFSQEFQIPIIPGFEGVSPGQLFPWLRGGTGRTFQEVRGATHGAFGELRPNRDPVLNALLVPIRSEVESQFPQATPEWLADWRVLKVGDRYAAAWGGGIDPAGNLQAQVVRELPVEGTLRSALHGQMRGRTEQVLAAQEARAAGGRTPWQWLGLGRQYGKSALQERLGFLTKFRKESDWAPSVLGRVVGNAIPSPVGATPEELLASRAGIAREFGHDLRRTGRFLTSQPLPGKVEQALLAESEKLLPGSFPELLAAARAPTDPGILDFFTGVRTWEEQQGARRIWKSEGLRHLYNEFRESPQGFLGRLKPHAPGSLGQKLLGGRPTESAFDLTRRALFDELEELVSLQGGGDAGFRDLLSGLELSAAEREAALGYASGKQILRRLGGFESAATAGVPWEERRWRQAEETLGWLRDPGQAEVRTAAEAYTRRFTGILDAAPHDTASQLGSSALLLPKARGFLAEFNRARAGGANFLEAMGQTATGPAARQYGAFFTGKAEDFTERTLALEYYPRKLNQLFAGAGLGLPAEDLLSGGSIFKGLFLKRILPAVAAYELYRYADYKLHSAGAPGPSDLYAGARSQAGLARARVFGKGGLFERVVGRRELFPGLDQWLPERDVEEEALHQESGLEPVRKGRWWLFGSKEEARGGKIDYFLPSAVSVARSRWQETDSSDLNTREHWAHSWIPLPENNFLGPLNWLTDRYWWEKRHSEGPNPDRPYLVSGKPFDPHTLHGGILNPLLGGLIKPQRVLYPEYVPKSAGGDAAKEQLRRINESLRSGADRGGIAALVGGSVTGVTGRGGSLGAPGVGTGGGAEELGSLLTISPGGMLTTETLPGETSGADFAAMGRSTLQREGHGERLSRTELRRINRATKAGLGGGLPVRASTFSRLASQTTPFSDAELDLIDTESGGIAGTKNLQDIMGLYGWMSRLLYNPKQPGPVIADPSRAYGYARRFHELGLGGLGGELSEVGRRFLRRPDRHDFYNPVRNQMPAWLPGPEYFHDFLHGDPYLLPRGELRLPGAAYEATHPVGMLRTRASSLGKSVPELMREMLFLEQPMSAYGEEVTGIGTALHKKIQRRWRRMGILETAEQTLENKALGITGHLDAILRVNGERQVAEIKTVGEKRFRQAERRPFEEHLDQINFYLHETHLAHGMVLYVNRDRPDQIAMHRIGFSPGRFRRTVDRVEDARRQLLGMVDQGTLNRGDLYDPISRFEILSDVAPYSANYTQVREYLTRKNQDGQLSEADNTRFQAAKKRVAEQKRHLALYPYRFRNVTLTERSYTVDRILDPNTFTVRESESPIRLAGVRSSQERIEQAYGEAPEGKSLAEHQFDQFGIRPGARVRVAVDADPLRRVADDTLQTQHAVVYGRGGNVNRQLIQSGVGTEKETDWSSPGVAARFDPREIKRGKIWEMIAHSDNPFCVVPGTPVLTREGLKSIERVSVADEVVGKDGAFHRVQDIFVRQTEDGEIPVSITLSKFTQYPLRLTPNHEVLAAKQLSYEEHHNDILRQRLKIEWLRAEQLEVGDWVAHPIPNWGPGQDVLDILPIIQELGLDVTERDARVCLLDTRAARGGRPYKDGSRPSAREASEIREDSKPVPRYVKLDDDFYRFAGYFIAEGSCSKADITLAFGKNEDLYTQDALRVIEAVFGIKGVVRHYPERASSGCVTIQVCSQIVAALCRHLFNNAGKARKRIPDLLLTDDSARLRSLIIGYFRGDGCTSTAVASSTVDESLAVRVWNILLKLGHVASFWIDRDSKHRRGRQDQYRIQLKGRSRRLLSYEIDGKILERSPKESTGKGSVLVPGYVLLRISEIQSIDYSGPVYDLLVADEHSYTLAIGTVHNSNKFLRVRSPLEELERGVVYGKNTGGWNNLAADYLWPTLASYAARHPILAGLSTGAFASFFFRSRGAKLLAAGIGAGVGAALSLGRAAGEAITGEAWKPGWTRKREELEEYWDALKYVKARGLAARYEQLAKEKEGVDVEKIARDSYQRGEQNKRRKNWLEKRKRELLRQGSRGEEVAPELAQVQADLKGLSGERAELGQRHRSISDRIHASVTAFPEEPEQRTGLRQDLQQVQQEETGLRERRKALLTRKAELIRAGAGRDEVARLQDDLDRLNAPIGVEKLGPYATRALAYREAFRSTLYGIDPGKTPFINLFRAFPKYQRELISPAIEQSSEQERRRIFALLPRAEQRVLGRYLGAREEEIPDRPRLSEFFQEHPLPDAGWRGWSEEVDLESLRQRAVRSERLDPFQSGLYNEQIEDAEERTRGISVPTLRGSTADLKNTLNALLSGHGLQQLRVAVDLQPHDGDRDDVRFDIEISQKRERDLASALQLHG